MRIITGSARGTKLTSLEGEATRPTSGRVKEAIFSMIQFDIEGRSVLDLFCGSGQLALEALSRGAAFAVMTDTAAEAVAVIKANAQKTRLYDRCRISMMDYHSYLGRNTGRETFDLIFLDPPFKSGFLKKALAEIIGGGFAKKTSIIICESGTEDIFEGDEALRSKFSVLRHARYGKTHITLLAPNMPNITIGEK